MDRLNPLEYRPISLISVPCKIYADILNKRLTVWLEQNDMLADEQNGFRRNQSCLDHLYVLTRMIKNRKLQKKDSFVCFVDAKKAFDNVNRDMLWYKLMKIGINGVLRAIQSLYDATQSAAKLGNNFTDIFPVQYGMNQGCQMSPTLYSIYVNDLADDIRSLNAGVDIGDLYVSILLYADDVALMAPNEQNLQKMLDCLKTWCRKWRMTLNTEKTQRSVVEPVLYYGSGIWGHTNWRDVQVIQKKACREYKNVLEFSSYVNLVRYRQHRRVLSNFKSDCLPLAVETGRHTKPKIPLNERSCIYCTENCVEDEKHFLLGCDFYADLRYDLMKKSGDICETFNDLDLQDKFVFLMSNDAIQPF
ncbi:unnamed protein product [Mytilus coruscus]|uniref:Reverse transcriptase domain-containing protein n=1 Tax=Mytilus coruscus TaxID=42192 RepID=A0A6J8C3D1_MYTCO|nr:unnamed protein product [Mytilus coruscus]